MKYKKLLLTHCFILIISISFSQVDTNLANIAWGDRIPLPRGYHKIGFVGDVENGFIQITGKNKRKVGFSRISGDLKYENVKLESLPKLKYNLFENIVQIDNKAYIIHTDYDKNRASEKIFIKEMDIKKGGFIGSAQQILATEDKVLEAPKYSGAYSYSLNEKFTIIIPEKGNRILVFYRIKQKNNESKNTDKIVYHLFDREWKSIWTREITMPRPKSELKIIGHRIVDNTIFLFVRTKSGEINWDTNRPEFDGVSVFRINNEDDNPKEYPLEFEGTNLYDIILGEGKNNSILLAGYFKKSRVAETFIGYFTAVFNPDKFQLENVNLFSFNKELITAFENEETKAKLNRAMAKGEEPGISDLETRKIIVRPDGGWYIIGEQHYSYIVRTNYGPMIHDLYMDIIVASVGSDGIQDWIIKIPKKQHFVNTTYGASVSAFEYKNNVYLFYLDHVLNKKGNDSIPREPYLGTIDDVTMMCVKIRPNGKIQQRAIYDVGETGYLINPLSIEEMKPGVLMTGGRTSFWGSNRTALIYLE